MNYESNPTTLVIIVKITGTGTIKNTATKTTQTEYDPNPGNNAITTIIAKP
ncbi:hypothetical protein [Methanobacterium formicicum]|uniref:hypothetical protein n=1 Tax=Methanobacterium formicicum TaxID=2162 RepID=UPI0034DF941A